MSVQVECPSCGKLLRAKSRYAGKVIRCPRCEKPMRLPEAIDTAKVQRPEAVPASGPPQAELEPPPAAPPVAVPGGGFSPALGWIIGGVVGGVLLLGAITAVLLLLLLGGGTGAGAFRQYIPEEADVMAYVDVATIVQTTAWQKLKEVGGRDLEEGLEMMTKTSGLKIEDIRDIWMAFDLSKRGEIVAMVRAAGTVDLKEVFEKKLAVETEEEDGITFYPMPGAGPRMSAHLIDSQTLLVGPRDALKAGIQRSREGKDSPAVAGLEQMSAYVSTSAPFWAAGKVDGVALRRWLPGMLEAFLLTGDNLKNITGAAMSGSANGSLSMTLALVLDSAETADKNRLQVEQRLAKAREAMAEAPDDDPEVAMMRHVMDGLSVSTSGEALCASISLDNDVLFKIIEKSQKGARRRPPRKKQVRPKPANPRRPFRWRR